MFYMYFSIAAQKRFKKPEKSRTPILIDGLTKDEMSKEQLEDHIMRLREELDREREERNYFQLERDKVHSFWDITDRKLKEAKAELRNLDKELEETEIKLQVEIKVYRQKMRHLLCEHQNTICELNTDAVTSKQALQAEQTLLENKLRNDLASLLIDIHHVDTETPIMELKKKYEEKIAHMRAISKKKLQDAETKNEKMHDELRLDFENQRKTEVSQVRDNWNKFISTLMEKDKDVYEESKALQIVADESNNLNKFEKELTHVLEENQQVTENLTEIQEEIAVLQNKMKYRSKKFDNKKEIELNNLASEYEMLQKRFKELQLEVAELRKTSVETMEKMKNKADAKHMQMEKKIQTLTEKIQKDLLLC
ncbi:dynein regulatory complex subunit 4 [Boleophthalmus pectinirostris]|uniref:dynein regulatory complex subunit 4 n=1 Tax=Boleophthalmus pectinirostris TaxID=150288 RepID=UPI002430C3A4|nr:dynein regulatory complex subunit 4 [Boleophthalmus pectinirostris]